MKRILITLALSLTAACLSAQTAKSRSALYTDIDTNLASGQTGGITAAQLRAQFKDVVASAYNVIAAEAQPIDADLTAIAALTGTNTIYYRSAANTWTAATIGSGLSFSAGTLTASGGGGGGTWGSITGTLSGQTDLQTALDLKANTSSLASVATAGTFASLTSKPTTLAGYGIADSITAAAAAGAYQPLAANLTSLAAQAPSYYIARANHTGTQLAATISDFAATASAAAPVQSVAGRTGAVTLAKADVGLGNVDNTTDLAKPISTATQTALDLKANTSALAASATTDTTNAANISSGLLPTARLAAGGSALQVVRRNAANTAFEYATISVGGGDLLASNNLSDLVSASTARTNLGLGSVDNTSDAAKPVSTATQTALDLKLTITTAASTYQPLDADLTSIAALTTTSFGRSFLPLADATAGRTLLGLGTLATQSGTFSGASSGTNTGDQTTITGNAGTATALATSRTIGGSNFDGTGNVTSFPAPGAIGGTTPSTGAFTTLSSTGAITQSRTDIAANTISNGLALNNDTISTLGNDSISPAILFTAHVTDIFSADHSQRYRFFNRALQAATDTYAELAFQHSQNGAAFADSVVIRSLNGGSVLAPGGFHFSGNAGFNAAGETIQVAGAPYGGTANLHISGQLFATSGAASTSPTTGALRVTGGAGISGALNLGGAANISGPTVTPPAAMGATAVDVTRSLNTYSATSNATLTYSATPDAGTATTLRITADGTDRTITIPSTYSLARGGNITTLLVPASTTLQVRLQYLSSRWEILGDPPLTTGTGAYVLASKINPATVALGVGTNLDWSLSNSFSDTISGSTTYTFSNLLDGQSITFAVTNGASGAITWPTVLWSGGTQPTPTPSKTDVYTFVRVGSTTYGSAILNF